ncbi:hypothetical protein ACN47A_28205 [Myxococcus fulvus]
MLAATGASLFLVACGLGDCPSGGYDESDYAYSSQCGPENPNQHLCERIE